MKFLFVFGVGDPKSMRDGFAHLGYPEGLALTLGILEIGSVVLYLVPRTSILGAILLTGYLGGAVSTHLRIGDPVFVPLVPGILVWVGLYFEDERIRNSIPLRKS
jgi:DoxX-like family